MADDTTLQLGGDPSGAVSAIREVAAEMRTMAERNVQAFESFGAKFDASVTKKVPEGADKATTSLGLMDDQVKRMAASFAAGALLDRGISTLGSIAAEAFRSAGAMVDLRSKTGLSLDTLQRMAAVSDETGVSMERQAEAAYKLGLRIAGGDDSAKEGARLLGLEWEKLRSLKPEDQWAMVMRALAGVTDVQERNRLGTLLMGREFAGVAAAVVSNWDDIQRAASIAGDAQIEALDTTSDSLSKVARAMGALALSIGGTLAQPFAQTISFSDKFNASSERLTYTQRFLAVAMNSVGADASGYIDRITGATDATNKKAGAATAAAKATRDFSGELADARNKAAALEPAVRAQILAARELGATEEELNTQFHVSGAVVKQLEEQTKKQEAADKAGAEEAKKHAAERKKLADETEKAAEAFRNSVKAFEITNRGYIMTPQAVSDSGSRAEVADIRRSMEAMAGIRFNTTWDTFKTGVKDSSVELSKIHEAAPKFSASMGSAFKGLPQVMMNAAQGGGDVGKSVGSSLGSALGDWAGKAAGPALGNMFGKTIGGAVGTMFGPVGTMVGGFLGSKIGNLAGKVFGGIFGDKGKKEAESLRNEFIKSAGGLTKLQEEAQKAGVSLDALMKAKNADQVKAAIEEITKKLDAHSQKLASAEQVAAKYGITLAEMGQGFRQSKLDETALGFAQDFDVLKTAGTDVKVITDKMGGSFAEYVQQVIDAGGTIPKELKPIAAAMIEQGSLTVKNGAEYQRLTATKIDLERQLAEAMKDTSATGVAKQAELKAAIAQTNTAIDGTSKNFDNIDDLPWAENLNDMFKDVMKSIGDLVGYLKDMLPAGFGVAATAGQNFGSKITAGLGGAIVAAGSLGTKVGQIDWDGMAREAKDALRDVEDSVNAVSFGHSPGGLKEYPLLLGKATAAMRTWRRDWASELREVEQRVNETGLPAMGRATQFAAQATGTIATNATAAAARAPSVNVEAFADLFVAVDPVSGAVRQVTDARQIERLVQQGLREGRFSLPVRNVVGRAA